LAGKGGKRKDDGGERRVSERRNGILKYGAEANAIWEPRKDPKYTNIFLDNRDS